MAYLDSIIAIRDNLVAEVLAETAYRASHGPKPTYSAGGRNVDWTGWLQAMQQQIDAYNHMIQNEEIYELPMRGY